jgi:hypothetical protein
MSLLADETIRKLFSNLEKKSGHFSGDTVLSQFFLLNNFHYSYCAIQNSPLAEFVGAETMAMIENKVQEAQSNYLENTWILLANKVSNKEGKGLDSSEVKKRFKIFSQKLGEIHDKHKVFNTRNRSLMQALANEAVKVTLPAYEKFWNDYSGQLTHKGDESKSSKYIRYRPATIPDMINRCYGIVPKEPVTH